MNTIEITDVQNLENLPFRIEVDEFVPFRFRTYERPLGAAYLRLGNYRTTLTELIVDPKSNLVRGITLTSFESLVPWPTLGPAAPSVGLPVLSVDWQKGNRIDLTCDFTVSLRGGELLIAWDNTNDLSRTATFGKAEFLISKAELRGVRFSGLSDREGELIA